MQFRLKQVEASCVLEPVGRAPAQADCLKPALLECLSALKAGGLRHGEWKNTGGPAGSFARKREALVEGGLVVQSGDIYELTEEGREVLGMSVGKTEPAEDQDEECP